jgi:hypothetical protein
MAKESGATHIFNGVYYKKGNRYAMYFQKGWRESASVTNEQIDKEGKKLNVKNKINEHDKN